MAVTLINRGGRTWTLKDGTDKDGKPVKRVVLPGKSIEALDEAEAKSLLDHNRDWADAANVVPNVTDKMEALRVENEELKARIAELEEQLPEEVKGKGSKRK